MTLAKANSLVIKWAERLRLLDWTITVRFAEPDENENCYGTVTPQPHAKTAEIVLSPLEWYSDQELQDLNCDVEVTIVHEMLHLHFVMFQTKEKSALEIVEENIISITSALLVALDRKDNKITGRRLSKLASLER